MQRGERTKEADLIRREAAEWLAGNGEEVGTQYADFLREQVNHLIACYPHLAGVRHETTLISSGMFLLGYYRGHEDLRFKHLLDGL